MEDTLLRIDDYFADKQNKILYFFGLAVIVFAVIYYTLFDFSENIYNESSSAYTQAKNQFDSLDDLDELRGQINKAQAQIEDNKRKLVVLKENNIFLDKEIKKLADNFFKPNDVNLFLDHLSEKALNSGIYVTGILNNGSEIPSLKLEKLYDVGVKFYNASFSSVVNYINSLEDTEAIVDVNLLDLNVSASDVNGTMNVVAWGVKY